MGKQWEKVDPQTKQDQKRKDIFDVFGIVNREKETKTKERERDGKNEIYVCLKERSAFPFVLYSLSLYIKSKLLIIPKPTCVV